MSDTDKINMIMNAFFFGYLCSYLFELVNKVKYEKTKEYISVAWLLLWFIFTSTVLFMCYK